jgi:hypothetical protein
LREEVEEEVEVLEGDRGLNLGGFWMLCRTEAKPLSIGWPVCHPTTWYNP